MKDEYSIIYHKYGNSKELIIYSKLINSKDEYIIKMDRVSNQLIIKPLSMDYRGKTHKFLKDGNRYKVGLNLDLPKGRFYLDSDSSEDEIIVNFFEENLED